MLIRVTYFNIYYTIVNLCNTIVNAQTTFFYFQSLADVDIDDIVWSVTLILWSITGF